MQPVGVRVLLKVEGTSVWIHTRTCVFSSQLFSSRSRCFLSNLHLRARLLCLFARSSSRNTHFYKTLIMWCFTARRPSLHPCATQNTLLVYFLRLYICMCVCVCVDSTLASSFNASASHTDPDNSVMLENSKVKSQLTLFTFLILIRGLIVNDSSAQFMCKTPGIWLNYWT